MKDLAHRVFCKASRDLPWFSFTQVLSTKAVLRPELRPGVKI